MDASIVVTAVLRCIGLLGAALLQYRSQLRSDANLLQMERLRIAEARRDRLAAAQLQSLAKIHAALSMVATQFSRSKLVAMLDGKTPVEIFDAQYFQQCEQFDRMLSLVAADANHILRQVKAIRGQMNHFWGNARGALLDRAQGTAMMQSGPHTRAVAAGIAIPILCQQAQNLLVRSEA